MSATEHDFHSKLFFQCGQTFEVFSFRHATAKEKGTHVAGVSGGWMSKQRKQKASVLARSIYIPNKQLTLHGIP